MHKRAPPIRKRWSIVANGTRVMHGYVLGAGCRCDTGAAPRVCVDDADPASVPLRGAMVRPATTPFAGVMASLALALLACSAVHFSANRTQAGTSHGHGLRGNHNALHHHPLNLNLDLLGTFFL